MEPYTLERSMPYYDQIYHSIRQMIINGVFQPGERIYEAKIAREFNVSRNPVREAVRALEAEGLLVIDDKSRITVFKPSIKDFEEIYQCRIVMESLAARLTTRLATERELNEIEQVLTETRKYLDNKNEINKEAIISCNARFHELIIRFSQNKHLQKQLDALRSLSHYYRVMNFQGENRDWTLLHEHEQVFSCMKLRDEDGAAKEMAKHITNDLKHFQKTVGLSDCSQDIYVDLSFTKSSEDGKGRE